MNGQRVRYFRHSMATLERAECRVWRDTATCGVPGEDVVPLCSLYRNAGNPLHNTTRQTL